MKTASSTRGGIGSHTLPNRGLSEDWITPKEIVDALGRFDLDPCVCDRQPWDTADIGIRREQDGLTQDWTGYRVWLNPPYGEKTILWLAKLARHGNGIALIFARTETRMFFDHVWTKADGVFFFDGRLFFHRPDGSRADHNAGGPSCLIAYGEKNVESIQESGLKGKLVRLERSIP